ncbi:MarR family transcriptional regulator, partial [Streptomyces koyangensis]
MDSPDPDGVLAEQLLRLTRRLHRLQRRQLEPLGITPAQARLLRTVAVCERPPRMADLAQRLEVVPRAVTSLVDGLEEADRVRRVPDPESRRLSMSSPSRGGDISSSRGSSKTREKARASSRLMRRRGVPFSMRQTAVWFILTPALVTRSASSV